MPDEDSAMRSFNFDSDWHDWARDQSFTLHFLSLGLIRGVKRQDQACAAAHAHECTSTEQTIVRKVNLVSFHAL